MDERTPSRRAARAVRAALAGCSAVWVLALAGCGSAGTTSLAGQDEAPRGPEPSLGPIVRVTEPTRITRPLDPFLLTADQTIRLESVRYAAMNRCLRERGLSARFTFPSKLPQLIRGMVDDRTVRSDLYGFFDVAKARTSGYHRPPSAEIMVDSLPPAGVPAALVDACRKDGVRAVGGLASPTDLELLAKLPAGGPVLPRSDSRYERVVGSWSACMKGKGFSYANPLAAIGDQRWRVPEPSADERAVAEADIECKISTNLVGVALAVQSASDKQYLQAHGHQLRVRRDTFLKAAGRSSS